MTPFLPVMLALPLVMFALPVMFALLWVKFALPMLPGTADAAVLDLVFILMLAMLLLAFLFVLPRLLVTAVAKALGAPSPARKPR
jgi:hypothetical protein